MLVKLAIALLLGIAAYLLAGWIGLDHVLAIVIGIVVGVIVFKYDA